MKKDDISRLLQRYLSAKEEGKEPYFDADQIDEMLDSFEDSNDYTYFDEVLALGLKLHPGNSALQIKKARQLADEGEHEEALDLLEGIIEIGNTELDMLMIECYLALDEFLEANDYLQDLIEEGRDYVEEIFEYITPLLNDWEMTPEAHDFADWGLSLFPDNLILKNELCICLEKEGEVKEAIKLCNSLVDSNPFSFDYWFMLGRLHALDQDFEKAIEAFDFALTCDDSSIDVKLLRAYCLYMNESYEKAAEAYLDIEKEYGDEGDTKTYISPLLAECYMKLDQYEKAYQLFSPFKNDPEITKESLFYANYIRCCDETGRYEEAEKLLLAAKRLFPDDLNILTLSLYHSIYHGKKKEAFTIANKISKFIEKKNTTPETQDKCSSLLHTGEYLHSKGEVKKAIDFYEKAARVNPKTPMLHLHLATAYFETNDMENFMKHLKLVSNDDIFYFLNRIGNKLFSEMDGKDLNETHIPPENLVKEFLKNKDNSN